jgi:hypothetical protein
MGIKLTGKNDISATLRRLPKQFMDVSAAAQYQAAQKTMELSLTRVPFEVGTLAGSAYVDMPTYTAKSAVVEFGYYGPDYIRRQHEDKTLIHPGKNSTNPTMGAQGESHFLSSAVSETEDQTRQMIQDAIDTFLRTGRMPSRTGTLPPRGDG